MSQSIKLLFFSVLRDITGVNETEWPLEAVPVSVTDLLEQLYERWPAMRDWDGTILVAADLNYIDRDGEINAGQEVAIMPPVQGG